MSELSRRTICRCDGEVSCQLMVQVGRKNPIAVNLAFLQIVIILESSLGPPLKVSVGAWAAPTYILIEVVHRETRNIS